MELLNKRFSLKVGVLGNHKFYTVFDEKMNCAVYQLKSNGRILEEYYPAFNIEIVKQKFKSSKNRVVSNGLRKQILELARKDLKKKKIFLVGCSANKLDGFHKAQELYNSTRIKFAINQSRETNSSLFILSAKYGLLKHDAMVPNYDLVMDGKRAAELVETVKKQIELCNISEIVFFKAGINKSYWSLMETVCAETNTDLIAIGTGCMAGTHEIKKILRAG